MDAITMPSTTLLASNLQSDFPAFTFIAGDSFHWSPSDKKIYYDTSSDDTASLLHELSHAILDHHQYTKDIELIEMERDAWQYATTALAERYHTSIDDEIAQDALDTYRDWLHARSTCPHCKATGVQTQKSHYKCIACGTKWRVNEARVCALRRYRI
jgi:hypothetical protein